MRKIKICQKAGLLLTVCFLILASCGEVREKEITHKLRYAPFTVTQVTDDFWRPKNERNLVVTVPHILRMCIEEGNKSGGMESLKTVSQKRIEK